MHQSSEVNVIELLAQWIYNLTVKFTFTGENKQRNKQTKPNNNHPTKPNNNT